jgi:hypothetical protein
LIILFKVKTVSRAIQQKPPDPEPIGPVTVQLGIGFSNIKKVA